MDTTLTLETQATLDAMTERLERLEEEVRSLKLRPQAKAKDGQELELAKAWAEADASKVRWQYWFTLGEWGNEFQPASKGAKSVVEADIQRWLETQGVTPTRVLVRKIEFLARAELAR